MKKRLRKKLMVGEFRELGFEFSADIEGLDEAGNEALFDQFAALIDDCEFYCEGAWGDEDVDLYISTGVINSDNEKRRAGFAEKIAALKGFANLKIGELE